MEETNGKASRSVGHALISIIHHTVTGPWLRMRRGHNG